MRTFILLSFLTLSGFCYGAPLDAGDGVINEAEPPSCHIIIEKDGFESEGSVSAQGGRLNQVYCKVECQHESVAPAIRWYRKGISRWTKVTRYTGRMYAIRRHFDSWSVLTFTNFLKSHVGTYKCRAWLGGEQGWQEKTVEINYGCPANSFFCDNFRCIPSSKQCDGVQDCNDGRDEDHCNYCDAVNEFGCDDKCIPILNRCDGILDCVDETDERDCVCNETSQFTCEDGSCISKDLVCDGFDDCLMDGSDEYPELCEPEPTSTSTEEVTTTTTTSTTTQTTTSTPTTTTTTTPTTTTTTLPTTTTTEDYYDYDTYYEKKDDEADDYGNDLESTTQQNDGDDTTTTTTTPTTTATADIGTIKSDLGPACISEVEFKCNNGECIPMDWFCDSYQDCPDNEDEMNCTTGQDGCVEGQFQCDEGECIPGASECDGVLDCPFGEDEDGCEGCLSDQFMCNNGQCIDIEGRCDTISDCADSSDEQFCFKVEGVSCTGSKIQCDDGLKCYTTEQRCNGITDCLDASDEKQCGTEGPITSPTDSPGDAGAGNGEVVSGEITVVETGDDKFILILDK